MSSTKFERIVWAHYRKQGRHDLLWRKTKDPYKILVSEVMLQQTQVERVVPFYKKFLKQFPTVQALARAPLSEVLKTWQGLGYNRRAKMLHQAAKAIDKERKGKFPKTIEELVALPGVGPYTAGAVAAFAYNQDEVFIETNIRTAVTYHFFPKKTEITDKQIIEILEQVQSKGKSREWYGALMDYGAHLKKLGVKLNSRSKHYAKQSKFSGSLREARGAILRALAGGPVTSEKLLNLVDLDRKEQIKRALEALENEGFVQTEKGQCYLAT
jgi:A/G-specific adenine glycosylase